MQHADDLIIDGSQGEGGGQIIRTALALSMVTGKPFRLEKIRANRDKPGLLSQHLTALKAATAISGARVHGGAMGSREISFTPGVIRSGDYEFAVGTAGSANLVLQTILPPLLVASGPSHLVIEGGTHNPWAPPFDFISRSFLPIIESMGPQIEARLERPGFYPAGGGRIVIDIKPVAELQVRAILERGPETTVRAKIFHANLPLHIAEREQETLAKLLKLSMDDIEVEECSNSQGPGNVVLVEVESSAVTEIFTGFGQRGVRAEAVAQRAANDAMRYLAAKVPIGPHLADQLIIPWVMALGGSFKTMAPSQHTRTNIAVAENFFDWSFTTKHLDDDTWFIATD